MRRTIDQVTPSEPYTRNQRLRFSLQNDSIFPTTQGDANVAKYFRMNEVARRMSSDMKLPNSAWNILFPNSFSKQDSSVFDQKYTIDRYRDWNLHKNYVERIFEEEHNREREFHPMPEYFERHPLLTKNLRCSIVQLMVTCARKLSLANDVLHNAVQLVDRYLSHTNNIRVNELDEIGAAALLLAYKNESSDGPIFPMRWLCSLMCMDHVDLRNRVLGREITMGTTLNWQLFTQSSYAFLRRYSLMFDLIESHRPAIMIATCIVERALLEADMLKFLPSVIAVMALVMSVYCTTGNDSKSVDWIPELLAIARVDNDNLQLCLCTFRNILQEETLSRTITFSRRLLGSLPLDSSVSAYDALLEQLANEIDRISAYLACFHPRTVEDEKIHKTYIDYLEYLASIPGICEYAAKLKLLENPSIVSSLGESHEEGIFSSQSGLEDSFLSLGSESNESTLCQPPVDCASASAAIDLCSETKVSLVVSEFLMGRIANLHKSGVPPVMIDSVAFRYPGAYKYLVTHPPLDL